MGNKGKRKEKATFNGTNLILLNTGIERKAGRFKNEYKSGNTVKKYSNTQIKEYNRKKIKDHLVEAISFKLDVSIHGLSKQSPPMDGCIVSPRK